MTKKGSRAYTTKQALAAVQSRYIGPPSFIGGRNVDWAKDMATGESPKSGGVLQHQCVELENFDIGASGNLIARKGNDKTNATAINSGGQIRSMYRYYKASTQAKYFIVHTGNDVGVYNLGTGAWTDKTGGLTISNTVPIKWITWNDMAYGFMGTGVLKFDGTTLTQIQDTDADCPDSTDGVVLDDVLFTARDGDAYPSRVPYSDAFDAEAWTATNFRRVRERDGHIIMSLMKAGSSILCNKDLSVFLLHGSGINSFAEEFLSDTIGQVGRMASATYKNLAFFQSGRGVEMFNPSSINIFNNIARGTCAEEIMGYTRAQREAAVMLCWPKRNRLLLSFPTIPEPMIYVWYLQHPQVDDDGNIWFPHSTYTGLTVTAMCVADAAGDEGTMYWGTDDGYIYECDSGWLDGTEDIDITMEWGFHDANVPFLLKHWTRVIIPALCAGTMNVTLNMDFSRKIDTQTSPTYLPEDAAIWDVAEWDVDKWAEAAIPTRKIRFHKMKGMKASVKISRSNKRRFELYPFLLEHTILEPPRGP
jgi:hypothetical protein